jgi:hypothetical protein
MTSDGVELEEEMKGKGTSCGERNNVAVVAVVAVVYP